MRHRHADLIKKWAENKSIELEFNAGCGDGWQKCSDLIIWNERYEYREVNHYQEFIDAFNSGKIVELRRSAIIDYGDEVWRILTNPKHIFNSYWEYRIIEEDPNIEFITVPENYIVCTIESKELVPFTLEDARFLMGKTVINKITGNFRLISSILKNERIILSNLDNTIDFDTLLRSYTFSDGSPCGKLVI